MAYKVENPDTAKSPFTGMTRKHYIDLAKYLLERAFKHVDSMDTPIAFPTVEGSKTYPQPNDPAWKWRSLEWECLERTLTVAAPLIHIEPDVEIRGIKLREYYCLHLYNALTPGHKNSLPLPEELPDATYQFTCEFGGLFKTLLLLPDVIWPHFTKKQQDEMAVTISKWGHHRTTQNNWRIFNITTLSFLKKNGYDIDDELLKSHLLWVVSYHSGGGWYLEQTYNYYTISLFVVYGTIWARSFGDKYYPEIAAAIEKSAHEMMKSYTNFFGRDGYTNMWARSICYRTWISGAFPVSFMLQGDQPLDPGFARRLCSGSLLQFVTREDFFHNDVPAMGFYGHKEYMLQNYSCPGSPFLMFLPFICLALPEDSPFWQAPENEGFWPALGEKSHTEVLEKPGLILVNHGKTGTAEILPGKTYYDDHNYSKLIFSTHFPWEDHNENGGTSMEYSYRSLDPRDIRGDDINFYLTGQALKNAPEKKVAYTTSQAMVYNGVINDVIYRQAIMRKPPNNGVGYIIDLADIVIPGGVIRVDRSRMAFEHELTLGHFGLPHYGDKAPTIKQFEEDGKKVITAAIPGRQVALVVHKDRNSEADSSTVVYVHKKRDNYKNPQMELMVCAMLHKMDDSEWTKEELSPIKEFEFVEITKTLSCFGANLTLADGKKIVVDFVDIDGNKMC
eukprot:gene7663-11752_t